MILYKAVKPTKIKVDAIRLELLSMMNSTSREIKKDFQACVKTWNHKVEFEILKSLKGGPTVLIGTDDEIFGYVNNGTPEHDIPASKPSGLFYKSGFKPKTQVGVIGSRTGGKFGPVRGHGMIVHHPGIAARNFDKTIADLWRQKFKRLAEEAIKRGVEKSGHKI